MVIGMVNLFTLVILRIKSKLPGREINGLKNIMANMPNSTLLDVVIPVREGEPNDSLRYALRSLINYPHRNVYIVGYKPQWVKNVIFLPRNQKNQDDLENTNKNLLLAVHQSELSDNFVWTNDDIYFMKPIHEISVYHQGLIEDTINRYKSNNRFHQAYSLIKTKEWLQRQGVKEIYSYELHFPVIFDKKRMKNLFTELTLPLFAIRPRTLYNNHYQLNGAKVNDAKDSTDQENTYISAGTDFDSSPTGEYVRSAFAAPSKYE